MFNLQIMKSAFMANFWTWLIITLSASFFMFAVIASVGFSDIKNRNFPTDLSLFLTQYAVPFALIFIIAIPNKLVTREVERGYFSQWLSCSLTRTQIIMSKINFYFLLIFGYSFILLVAGLISMIIFGFNTNYYGEYALLILGFFLLTFASSGIVFILSSFFNKIVWTSTFSASILIAFFIFNIFSSSPKPIEYISYFSINTLYNPDAILNKSLDKWVPQLISLFLIGVVLYTGSVFIFKYKDLQL